MDNIEISSQNNVHPGRLVGQDENGEDVYSDARALTTYELMRVMSIPDSWPVPADTDPKFLRKLIGEGVPSLLVKKIFENIVGVKNEED
jgi:DNA (cytosine-5)-methyltransferase 1